MKKLKKDKDIKMTPKQIELEQISYNCRKSILEMSASAVGCHLGGSLSVIDILVAAYNKFDQPQNKIILSKGHAVAALYSILKEQKTLQSDPIVDYGKANSLYLGHPSHSVPGIDFPTGSLGHGASYAMGWALACKKNNAGYGIAICGDGELQEGLCWETFQISSAKNLGNYYVIVDINRAQNDGWTKDVSDITNYAKRFESFGFEVLECNGVDAYTILKKLDSFNANSNQPKALIVNTIKGKGVGALENKIASHYVKISMSQAQKWINSLIKPNSLKA